MATLQSQMNTWSEALRQRLPAPLRKPLQLFDAARMLGVFQKPEELLRHIQHHKAFADLHQSLLQHRYATAVLLAHQCGLYEALMHYPIGLDVLAVNTGLHRRATETLVRTLEAMGHVYQTEPGVYKPTAFTRTFLVSDGAASMSPMLQLLAAQATAFAELPDAMQTGQVPAALDVFSEQSEYLAFLDAVNAYLSWTTVDFLSKVELPPINKFIVGSMGVSFSARLLHQFPQAQVTYGCLSHLIREIPRLCDQYEVDMSRVSGIHAHAGEPGDDRWGDEDFDLVFLTKKMILDPENQIGQKFASKAFEVLRPGGVAVFWETVYHHDGPTPLTRALEGIMDIGASPTALTHTDASIEAMMTQIGFKSVEVVPLMGDTTTFVVARKG